MHSSKCTELAIETEGLLVQTTVFYAFCAFKKNPKRKSRLKRDKEKERVRKGELALARSLPVEKPRDSRVTRARAAHSPSGILSRGISLRSSAKMNVLTQTHYLELVLRS